MARIVVSQTSCDGVKGSHVEWAVATGHPAPIQSKGRTKPVKVKTHHDATRIGEVGKNVTHRHWLGVRVVREGNDDVILLKLAQCRRARESVKEIYRRNARFGEYLVL